jgi:ABC-type phosphate/phosphonate transport system substrate-binding protein
MSDVVKVGAVAYDPKVVPIWEGMRDYFREAGVPTDYVLFSNYEAQVDALFGGVIDIAWTRT